MSPSLILRSIELSEPHTSVDLCSRASLDCQERCSVPTLLRGKLPARLKCINGQRSGNGTGRGAGADTAVTQESGTASGGEGSEEEDAGYGQMSNLHVSSPLQPLQDSQRPSPSHYQPSSPSPTPPPPSQSSKTPGNCSISRSDRHPIYQKKVQK